MVGHKLRHLASLTAGTTTKLESSLPVFPFHTNKVHLPLILVSPADQFRHVFRRMLLAAMAPDAVPAPAPAPAPARPGLRKIAPYWYPYTTMAKGRWLDREILEIVSTEFRDRSIEYYVWLPFYRARFADYVLKESLTDGFSSYAEIRAQIWRDYYQRQSRKARHDCPQWGPHRKCRASPRASGHLSTRQDPTRGPGQRFHRDRQTGQHCTHVTCRLTLLI